MKILLLLALFLTSTAFASQYKNSFLADTVVPTELQDEIVLSSYQKFGCINNLKEVSTKTKEVKIDQGVIDIYYSTVFKVSYYFDGQHPMETYITVESVKYSFSNGKNTSVLDVQSDSGDNMCP